MTLRPALPIPAAALAIAALAAAGAPTASAAAPRCTASMLSARVTAPSPGAGQRVARLVLKNTSSAGCQTQGYVGLQLAGAGGRRLPTTAVRAGGKAPVVVLAPGASARATLQWGVIAGGSEPVNGPCEPTPTRLLVIPPNGRRQIAARWTQGPVCQRGRFTVSPLRG